MAKTSFARSYGYALLTFVFFSSHDAIIKALGAYLPIFQIVFFAALFSLLFLAIIEWFSKDRGSLWPVHPWYMAIRMLLMVVSLSTAFYAFSQLQLSEVYALLFTTPLLITAWSVPILKEHVGLARWIAVIVGLAGVLVVLRPGIEAIEWGHISALVSALTASLAIIIIRKVGNAERSVVLIAYPALGSVLLMGALLPTVYVPMGAATLATLVLVGALFVGAQLCTIAAYRIAPSVALIAPVQYTQILWATLFGVLFFDEYPDFWVAVGAAIIIGSGLFVVWRESKAPAK